VYFVTTKRAGYSLFCMTPSERAAIALTEDQKRVHVLERTADSWTIRHEWPVEEHSHTELMTRLATCEEPASVAELVRRALGT
jgi:hypothetical protein